MDVSLALNFISDATTTTKLPFRGYDNGAGDISTSIYLTPHYPGFFVWGIGPSN